MASEIKYTFFQYDPKKRGRLNCACVGKKTVYDGFQNHVDVYSLNYNSFKKIAVWRIKWKPESFSTNTLNIDVQSIAA